jgi:hypothetical protein
MQDCQVASVPENHRVRIGCAMLLLISASISGVAISMGTDVKIVRYRFASASCSNSRLHTHSFVIFGKYLLGLLRSAVVATPENLGVHPQSKAGKSGSEVCALHCSVYPQKSSFCCLI